MKLSIAALLLLIPGFLIGNYFGQKNLHAPLEVGVVHDAALDIRLKVVLLENIREENYNEAIRTLESSLLLDQVLLESCRSDICKELTGFESSDVDALLRQYQKEYGDFGNDL